MEQREYEMMPEQAQDNKQPELGMKWFKFLIYFSLFAGALSNLFDGIVYIAGFGDKLPEILAEEYYFLPDNFRVIEVVFGVFTLATAAWGIYTRFQLSGFKKNAPECFYAMYIISSVISMAYSITGIALTTSEGWDSIIGAIIGGVVGEAVFILCNVTYFRKRQHLFVN